MSTLTHFTELTKLGTYVLGQKGKYVFFFHNLSGSLEIQCQAEGVEVEIIGLYTGTNQQTFTLHTLQRHSAPHTHSNLLIKGVFNDEAKFTYSGLIRIEKNAPHAHAYQKNQNLVLSPSVFVQSEPNLEILNNDVFCTHGSTTGKLNNEHIWYLMSRGLSENSAQNLLVQGFINDIYERIEPYKTISYA